MGKRLTIKGADFSQVAIPSSQIVWLNTYEEPSTHQLCVSGSDYSVFGLPFVSGTKVSVLKCCIFTDATGGSNPNQMSVGSKFDICVITYSGTTFNSKNKVGEFEITSEDIQNGYKIVTFTEVTLENNQFIGIGGGSNIEYPAYIPIARNQGDGTSIKYLNSAGNSIGTDTNCKGIAVGYISEE